LHLDLDGTSTAATLELKDGGTRAVLNHPKLQFGSTYSFIVEASIKDLWGNTLGERFVRTYTIRTVFALDFPSGVNPSSTEVNFSKDENMTLRFTNPVVPTGANIEIRSHTKEGYINVPFSILQGEDGYTLIVDADFDLGIEYEITVFKDSKDIYGYDLDKIYIWKFKTYIPPTPPDEPDDTDEEPSYWWVYALIAGITILLLAIVAITIVLRVRHKNKLKRLWNEGGEGRRIEERRRAEDDELRKRVSAGAIEPGSEIGLDAPEAGSEPSVGPSSSFLDYATTPSGVGDTDKADWGGDDEEDSWEE